MVKEFITVVNGVVTGRHAGDLCCDLFGTEYYGHERVEIPAGAEIRVFDRLEFYTPDWKRKADSRLIDEGLIPMPGGYVPEGEGLRPMTPEERVIAGLDEPRPGTKVLGGEIVPMPPEERRAAGQLADGEYRELKSAEAQGELDRRLSELSTEEAKARAELDGGYAETRREKLAALLAVKQQPGWPDNVEWPKETK